MKDLQFDSKSTATINLDSLLNITKYKIDRVPPNFFPQMPVDRTRVQSQSLSSSSQIYPAIEGMATGTPEHVIRQADAAKFVANLPGMERHKERIETIYKNTRINTRHLAYNFLVEPESTYNRSIQERMQAYKEYGIPLAEKVARQAIESARKYTANIEDSIRQIVFVSSTGFVGPGIDAELIERLGLRRDISRATVNFMGCAAAMNGLLATAIEDIRSLSHSLSAIPSICVDSATVIVSLAYLAWLSVTLFAITVFISAISIGYVQSRVKKAHQLFQSSRQEEDNLLKHFQAITKGIKELKLNRSRRADFAANHLGSSVSKLSQKNTTAMKSMAIANSLGQFGQFATLGFTIFGLPWLMHIPVSMLASYVLISSFLSMPLQNILNRIPDLLRANIALNKIEMMKLSLVNESQVRADNERNIKSIAKLELDRVTYVYNPVEKQNLLQLPHPGDRPKNRKPPRHPAPNQYSAICSTKRF